MMNLLFDLDGTLADPLTAFESSITHAYTVLGLEPLPQSTLRGLIGPPLHTLLPDLLGPEKAHLTSEVMRVFREHHAKSGLYEYRFYPGMKETLLRLRERHQVFVATSKPRIYAVEIFRHFNEAGLFHEVYGSELSGVNSRKGELIGFIMRERSLAPTETIMIGDRKHDLIGAQENGIRSIGVTWGYGSEEELRIAKADRICRDWAELERTIVEMNQS